MSAHPTPAPTTIHTVTPLPGNLTHKVGTDGYLESYSLGVTLLVLCGVVVASGIAAAVLRRRRGRRLLPRLPRWSVVAANSVVAIVLLLAGVLVLVNNYVGYVPTLGALFTPPGTSVAATARDAHNPNVSHVVRMSIPDRGAGVPTGTAYVYLPPGYYDPANATRHYPTVYLFHGYPGRPQDWFTAGRVQSTMDLLLREHYVGPMIVVSPTASTGYLHDDECLNAPGHFALENYLAYDVVRAVDRTFRTYRSRSYRAIGGMSSGAFCALNVGLHHLHRFSVILASEPYGDPGLHPLHRVLGNNWALWRANSPSFYIPLLRFRPVVATFLDSGGFDVHTTPTALRLAQQLAARGQEASYRPAPRQHHTWREARMALPYALIFAWQHFGRLPGGGSDRADVNQFRGILAYAQTLPPPRAKTSRRSPPPTAAATATATPTPTPARSPSPAPTGTGSATTRPVLSRSTAPTTKPSY